MGFSETLDSVFRSISGKSTAVEEKITRLRRAKSKLHSEQVAAMNQLKLLAEPDLGADWQGTRAHQFDAERQKAKDRMKFHLTEDVDLYFQQIEAKIGQLKTEHDTLQAIGSAARGIEALAKASTHETKTLEHQLAALKGRMF